ncbi:hypothetical protein GJ744_009035 [Endocarpon pusillum]|uniref:Uncharacterized protein n=1 Tax=Endocarpon pusillum TaxID=364733 RepID=A0A8H7AGM2_9EURO|nr:hypothetical protein GJ744_009035 [Endocarpon pusillum]
MNSNLGILFLLMLFTRLPLHFLPTLPFAFATPVPAPPPVPLAWLDQQPTHTHKPFPLRFLTPLPPPRNPEDHLHPPLNCGPATHKHGFAGGCVRRERDVYMVEGKRDGTVVRVAEGGSGRPMVGGRTDFSVDPNRHPASQLKAESKKNK